MSAGRLNDAEAHGGLPPVDVRRATASATFHRGTTAGNLWATMLAWGVNGEDGKATTHAVLLESSATMKGIHTVFGRVEVAGKSAHDLHVHESTGTFTVGKLQLGYTRYVQPRAGLQAGIGGSLSASLVPAALGPRYGGRVPLGFGVFFTIRPAAHAM